MSALPDRGRIKDYPIERFLAKPVPLEELMERLLGAAGRPASRTASS